MPALAYVLSRESNFVVQAGAPSITRSMRFALKQSGDLSQFLSDNFFVDGHGRARFSLISWLTTTWSTFLVHLEDLNGRR